MMKFAIILFIFCFLTSANLFAVDCKYFKDQFVGNFKIHNYECNSNSEEEYFKCYSENDHYVSVSTIHISPVPMGNGIALSVKKIDSDLNVVDESFLSEINLHRNETFNCNEVEVSGTKVQTIKQELTGNNSSKFYSMLTKRNSKMELEIFSSLGGVTTKQVFVMEAEL